MPCGSMIKFCGRSPREPRSGTSNLTTSADWEVSAYLAAVACVARLQRVAPSLLPFRAVAVGGRYE